jgi:hypothetical protein
MLPCHDYALTEDDPTFDPKAYYDGLIAKATLPELLQTVSTLAAGA